MAVLTKTIADIVVEWERTDKMHPYPPFAIEWAIKKPGEDKALLGIVRHLGVGEGGEHGHYIYEIWEVAT